MERVCAQSWPFVHNFQPRNEAKKHIYNMLHNMFFAPFYIPSRWAMHASWGMECTPRQPIVVACVWQYPSNYNLKACILRCKTHDFASQYAAYCRPKCSILPCKAFFFKMQNKS